MPGPLVSILMPVYNSFDFVRSENNRLLPQALDAILAQTHANLELIILDNQSTDDTGAVCRSYAERDPRVRYLVDTQKRYPEGGITQAATFRTGTYTMVANDDDLWHPTYIEKMLAQLEAHPELDMCYSNGVFVDVQGTVIGPINQTDGQVYSSRHSPLSNFCRYHLKRNPIPLAFGLFRSEAYSKVLPFEDFDDLKANVDNLGMSKFFLSGLTCAYLDEPLFSYRRKERALDPKRVAGMPGLDRPLEIWLYYLLHQFRFYKQIEAKFDLCTPTAGQRRYLYAVNVQSLVRYSHRIIHWVHDRLITGEGADKKVAAALMRRVETTVKKPLAAFPELGNFPDDAPETVCFHPAVVRRMLESVHASFSALAEVIRAYHALVPSDTLTDLAQQVRQAFDGEQGEIERIIAENQAALDATAQILKPLNESKQAIDKEPLTTVISASMNLGAFLEDTLRSVANQSSEAYEHLVIDGGSTDKTLDILKASSGIRWISEKDRGYPDALRKGVRMARGKYVIQCAVSDALANEAWIQKSIDILEAQPDVSLVWGFPERLSEDGVPGNVSYPQFHHSLAPRKTDFFRYWLKTSFFFPEGNLCVRKEVLEKCYPGDDILKKTQLDWLAFSYAFHRSGYLSYHLPIVANFGRAHGNQMGEGLMKSGRIWKMHKNYLKDVRAYRWKILLGLTKPVFRDGAGNVLGDVFDRRTFAYEYVSYFFQNAIRVDPRYLSPKAYRDYAFKKIRYYWGKIRA